MKRILLFVAITMLAACGEDQESPSGELGPPENGRVVLTRMTATPSQVTNFTTTIDAVSGRFEAATCVAEGTSSCSTRDAQSGPVSEAALARLFSTIQSDEFQVLRSEYRAGNDDTAPDGGWTILTVRTGSSERTVQWESNYPVPAVLARLVCMVDDIRGSLSQCAQH